ncbi:MAG: DegT/DnrJ/EryC1/StrS family aminotransferase [Promethearchaeota archaeon]
MKVPLCVMYMDDEIKKVVLDVLESGQYINGPQAKAFEEEFARFIGTKRAVSVNSGTSALFIAFMELGIKPGDEVIVPSHTFIASVSQAIHLGAKPVFVEADPNNYTMDIDDVRKKITNKTKAIVAVHIYGHPVDMDPLMSLAREFNITVIEDCAQSHGTKYKGKNVGTIGHYSCFSFFPSKIMNVGGDGGMILTNNEQSADRMAMLKNHGRKKKYTHELFGMNMRMPEIPAAIGRVQLKKLPFFIKRRKNIVKKYTHAFLQIPEIQIQKTADWADPVYYVYTIQLNNREKFINYLKDNGVSTGIHYPIPLHCQPIIKKEFGEISLPVTEKICQRIISIPLSAAMTDEQVNYVIKKIQDYFSD